MIPENVRDGDIWGVTLARTAAGVSGNAQVIAE
jgi:hypothetical protein